MSITNLIQRDVQIIRSDETCGKAATAIGSASCVT